MSVTDIKEQQPKKYTLLLYSVLYISHFSQFSGSLKI